MFQPGLSLQSKYEDDMLGFYVFICSWLKYYIGFVIFVCIFNIYWFVSGHVSLQFVGALQRIGAPWGLSWFPWGGKSGPGSLGLSHHPARVPGSWGAAPALVIRHLLGNRARLRPCWDTSLWVDPAWWGPRPGCEELETSPIAAAGTDGPGAEVGLWTHGGDPMDSSSGKQGLEVPSRASNDWHKCALLQLKMRREISEV